jgi:hypothetical protein
MTQRRYPPYALRFLGTLALLGIGAVHIDQYFVVHYHVVPVIGTLFGAAAPSGCRICRPYGGQTRQSRRRDEVAAA